MSKCHLDLPGIYKTGSGLEYTCNLRAGDNLLYSLRSRRRGRAPNPIMHLLCRLSLVRLWSFISSLVGITLASNKAYGGLTHLLFIFSRDKLGGKYASVIIRMKFSDSLLESIFSREQSSTQQEIIC